MEKTHPFTARSEGLHPTRCKSILIKQRGSGAWMKEYIRCLMLQVWIIHRVIFHLWKPVRIILSSTAGPSSFQVLFLIIWLPQSDSTNGFYPTFCSPSPRYSCHYTISTEIKWWCLVQSSKLLDFLQLLCSHHSFDHRCIRFCKDPLVTRTLLFHFTAIPSSELKNHQVYCVTLKVRTLKIFWPTRLHRLSFQAQQWC